jgi:adenine deaminase
MGLSKELIAAEHSEIEVDLLLAGGKMANLPLSEVHRADVAIHKGRIAGFDCVGAGQVVDLDDKIIAPGFIDGHVHIKSSMVTVPEYARAVVPRAPQPWSSTRTRSPICGVRQAFATCWRPQGMFP